MTPLADRDPALALSTGLHDDAIIVRAAGELDLATAPLLRAELERVWALPELPVLIMDLSELRFCDSTGLSALIAALKRSRARGTRLMLAGLTGAPARVLTITGLAKALELHPDITAALRAATRPPGRHDSDPHGSDPHACTP
ncbi:STAS domain-containing protein [Planomonospora sp. ID67723]|uniref:STAS domain-containing protein n=1 Tax=Planomonospora sp. ID67723 TaxID=2738134 RepID=UPI0018C3624C|nr:STAS domain-containing protein [Planomonospora sp. ID67723]MBG0831988.1 STAS domain-containing protein [Planomonospora sp. ID67723]